MTENFILTGAPGAGKTVLIRELERRGFSIVEEAATDVIAGEQANGIPAPWEQSRFVDTITDLQLKRMAAPAPGPIRFHDRSLICTFALAQYLSYPIPDRLHAAIERMLAENYFERRVFFVRLLGFIEPTAARRIGYDEAQEFERVHEEAYRQFGFKLVDIGPAVIADRADTLLEEAGGEP